MINSQDFIKTRSFLLHNVNNILASLTARREDNRISSDELFGDVEEGKTENWDFKYPVLTKMQVLLQEKDALGLYVSGNPLTDLIHEIQDTRISLQNSNIHLILVEKIRKIFTRNNQMMLALQITHPEENFEGIVFPTKALELSQILVEKELFWICGNIVRGKNKNSEENSTGEFIELPKLTIDLAAKHSEGLGVFAKKLGILNHDKEIQAKQKLVTLQLPKKLGVDFLKEIKNNLQKESFENSREIRLELETPEGFKKVRGKFFIDTKFLEEIQTKTSKNI
jgi:DNA polymerase III alpha subunit